MSKKLNVSGLFSSEPLPFEEAETPKQVKEVPKATKTATKKNDTKVKKDEMAEKASALKNVPENIVEQDATSVNLSLNLGKIKKKKPIDYISFKLKRDVHNQLGKIAKKENIDFTGNLIHLILEDFIKQYNKD